eukprot:TRINITY_DN14573_c0_g1_i1.p1 TRINITY_DN14573_c0_g1~~TRINITY_DN14573_c0_g1_i1.p1  ORF type:complete len:330 (+),score=29.06 TRINITY_DN14573_c0_g1_i1:146-1135(+)
MHSSNERTPFLQHPPSSTAQPNCNYPVISFYRSHFRNNPLRDGVIYLFVTIITIIYGVLCIFAHLIVGQCSPAPPDPRHWSNPAYDSNPCLDYRHPALLGLSLRDATFGRRILVSILLGAVIGYERRSPDRPAGIRTMALTSLGACAFTLASMFAFTDSSMEWDASRVTAAIPSGVGFLGAGVIYKALGPSGPTEKPESHQRRHDSVGTTACPSLRGADDTGPMEDRLGGGASAGSISALPADSAAAAGMSERVAAVSAPSERAAPHSHAVVTGLTTAASLWLSAAVGAATGGGMYFPAAFVVATSTILLRFGPRAPACGHDGHPRDAD